jgi:hypothetical protein
VLTPGLSPSVAKTATEVPAILLMSILIVLPDPNAVSYRFRSRILADEVWRIFGTVLSTRVQASLAAI